MKKICITGGNSFIGSHLAQRLMEDGDQVVVIDHLRSKGAENLADVTGAQLLIGSVRDIEFARKAFAGCGTVFHLAAAHGGRGYIDSHPVLCSQNMALDADVLYAAAAERVDKVVFASSACVYPIELQSYNRPEGFLLREEFANTSQRGAAFPDGEYGWAKLMGEMQLAAYVREGRLGGAACRIFNTYGPKTNETHAIIALLLKALMKQDPFPIWGTGQETRNFTYVSDIVEGMVRIGKLVKDGSAVNVGLSREYSILETAETIFSILGWRPQSIRFETDRPVGAAKRCASTEKLKSITGWEPSISLHDGLEKTIEWYLANRWDKVRQLDHTRLLTEK